MECANMARKLIPAASSITRLADPGLLVVTRFQP